MIARAARVGPDRRTQWHTYTQGTITITLVHTRRGLIIKVSCWTHKINSIIKSVKKAKCSCLLSSYCNQDHFWNWAGWIAIKTGFVWLNVGLGYMIKMGLPTTSMWSSNRQLHSYPVWSYNEHCCVCKFLNLTSAHIQQWISQSIAVWTAWLKDVCLICADYTQIW